MHTTTHSPPTPSPHTQKPLTQPPHTQPPHIAPTQKPLTRSGLPSERHARLNRPLSRYWTCGRQGGMQARVRSG